MDFSVATKVLRRVGLISILSVSVAVNVILAGKVTLNSRRLAALHALERLSVGAQVPPIRAKGIGGDAVVMRYDDVAVPTLLYVMRPTCAWCVKNAENFSALEAAAGSRYRVVVLSTEREGVEEYAEQHFRRATVLTDIDESTIRNYKLGGTPQTIVVGTDGRVQKNWSGAYTGSVASEIEGWLGFRLPGLVESAPRVVPAGVGK